MTHLLEKAFAEAAKLSQDERTRRHVSYCKSWSLSESGTSVLLNLVLN